jgi:metal-responsive CopG/Arc/MetJ family transcriptional regulator
MKVKTSITLSEEILHAIDQILGESKNRSAFIEYALRDYLLKRSKALRNEKDLEILNRNSKRLNKEAQDVLTYQVEF